LARFSSLPSNTRLRARRESAGLSLSELARRSRISKGRLSQIERGLVAKTEELIRLATILECEIGDLVEVH
jgi:transcriptional regulator with XRE-family HTH domain